MITGYILNKNVLMIDRKFQTFQNMKPIWLKIDLELLIRVVSHLATILEISSISDHDFHISCIRYSFKVLMMMI